MTASFFSHSSHCLVGSWIKWPWWQRWGLCMGLTTWTATHQDWPGYNCCWVPDLPTTETNNEPQIWQCSLGWPASNLKWSKVYIGPLSSWKGQQIVLTGVDACSGYGFSFPACNGSAKTTTHGLKESLIHCHGIPHRIASDQGTHFTKKCNSGPTIMNSTGLTMFPITLKQLAWKKMELPFKDIVTAPIRWQQPEGLGQGSPEVFELAVHHMVLFLS